MKSWRPGIWCRAMLTGLALTLMVPGALATAQEGGMKPVQIKADEKTVDVPSHKVRFVVQKDWKVEHSEGIYFISTPDTHMVMVVVTLDKPEEIPEAISALDKMIPVTGARFGKSNIGAFNGIPAEMLFGAGTLQPSGQEVDLMSVTMNVGGKPLLSMFYVHHSKLDVYQPQVQRVLETFSLVLTPQELDKLRQKAPAAPK